MTDSRWRDHAACRNHPTDMFFPGRNNLTGIAAAKAICAGCPVKAECLELALSEPEYGDHGVWGGLSANERNNLRRERPNAKARYRDLAPHGTGGAYRRHYREGSPLCDACRTWKSMQDAEAWARRREVAS